MRLFVVLCLLVTYVAGHAAVTDGLVAHYKFDEANGTAAADSIRGVAGNGTLNNFPGTPWVAGKIGGAVLLDGADDWISTPIPLADNISSFSFSGWVLAETAPTWASIAKNWGGSPIGQFHFGLDNASGQLSNYLTNVVAVKESTVFPLNAWQHVVVTYDGSTHRIYRNGSQVASASMSVVLARAHSLLAFGAKTNASGTGAESGDRWKGKFDDFGLWNRALTAAEITTIYQNGLAGVNIGQSGPPLISSFTASPPNVATGAATTLAWSVSNQTSLTLHGGSFVNQNVTGQTSIGTGPLSADTTYTLTAANTGGSTQKQVLVGVNASLLEPQISEFLAEGNTGVGLTNSDYRREDWIEIRNPNATYTIDVSGYHLTDDAGELDKWAFPAGTTIPPGGYLLVFCSELDLPLHASFKLGAEGEYLALVKPNGTTIVQQFSPLYPAQLPDVSYSSAGYLAMPTPGAANAALAGPILASVTENPPPPLDAGNLVIEVAATAQVGATITNVTLLYRVMFGSEVSLPMTLGGDGKYRATIPASASGPGQMVRWRVTATDSASRTSKWPLYLDPANSPEYLGTMVQVPTVSSPLPIIHRFVQNAAAIDVDPGTRCSLFFNGEFYDNLTIRIRGNTSRAFPKKSHKIEMNSGHKFRFKEGVPRVTEIDLNTTYTDKSYARSILTSEHQLAVGLAAPEVFAVRIQQNSAFYSVALFTENPDEDFLVRRGFDPDGAYYKAPNNNTWDTAAGFEKKTRQYEANSDDLAAFIAKLKQTGTALEATVFDEVDVPGMVNYMATVCVTQNIDASDKNHFAYRDTNGNREWRMLPWDLDLTFGPNALNTDTIVYNQNYASHPYIGASPYLLAAGKYNRFLEAIVNTPRARAMLDRRIRSLNDQFLATNWFQSRIDQLIPLHSADVLLDQAQWGANAFFGSQDYTLQAANDRIKNEYLAPRLGYLNSGGGIGLPSSPPSLPALTFGVIDSNPPSGNQEEEFIEIRNTSAFSADISGYTLDGQTSHTFKQGTVILPNESLYLSPKVLAFRGRTTSPKGGERRFVQGDYPGQLSARGGTLTIRAGGAAAPVVATTSYSGNPSAVQQFLRITEVNYAPAPGGGFSAGNYEFVELRNTGAGTLSLVGVTLSGGIDFSFTGSAVTSLAPGAYVVVVKNSAAFVARYGSGLPVAGQFTGSLDNSGDRLHLADAVGENVLDFDYEPTWHPITNGSGFTLTTLQDAQNYTLWDVSGGWQPSGKLGGTPGTGDQVGDADADGMPDQWEALNGLSPTSPGDAIQDRDADGQSNRDEYTAGTLPNDAGSRFQVETITRDAGNTIQLTFIAQPNRTYAVQRKTAFSDPAWSVVQTTAADPSIRTIQFSEAISGGSAIYRVITPAP